MVDNVDAKRVSLFENASHSKNIGPMNPLSSPAVEHDGSCDVDPANSGEESWLRSSPRGK